MSQDAGRSYWEKHAQHYDRSMLFLGQPMAPMIALVTEAVQARGAASVLEIGCGSGLLTEALARAAREIVATDYAHAMVTLTAARLAERGATNVRCLRADLYALPFDGRRFEVVVAANVLHLVPDLPGALAALRGALAPGGTLLLPTFLHAETWLSRATSRLLGLTGFPAPRRFTCASLGETVVAAGLEVRRAQVLTGLLPIGFVEARAVGPA